MITWFLAAALAAEPIPVEPESVTAVRAIEAATAFRLSEAEAYGMRADRPPVEAGWILRIEVEPGFGRGRQVDQPVLYVGEYPARVLNHGEEQTCLVVWAPGAAPLEELPIFFGSQQLPERVDAERARAELEAAVRAGARPLTPRQTEKGLTDVTLEAVWTAAQAQLEHCGG